MGILQLPYALKQGGWAGVFYIMLAAAISAYSGEILIKYLYTIRNEATNMLPTNILPPQCLETSSNRPLWLTILSSSLLLTKRRSRGKCIIAHTLRLGL
ncbi:hypothetical protein BX661DRAFT_190603, partial [Kickxella alabastrina]|uniref:uncharacterized protein n=1 Tax=Kickxella alabastrina TaxID=61397 RepID=UPI002220DE66